MLKAWHRVIRTSVGAFMIRQTRIFPCSQQHLQIAWTCCAGVEGGCRDAQGLAEGQDRVSAGGCGHAPAVAYRVDAAEHPYGLRSVPDRVPQYALDPWREVSTHLAPVGLHSLTCISKLGCLCEGHLHHDACQCSIKLSLILHCQAFSAMTQPCAAYRGRIYNTSFRCKINAWSGEYTCVCRWFHDTLVDGDLAINSMMWQNAGKSGLDQWNFTLLPTSTSQVTLDS